jgi:cyclic pyranopterin phosphate synthase
MGTDGLGGVLVDRYLRVHDYLRISLTDNCNFRCLYCMPDEDMSFLPNDQLMQAEEILALGKLFVGLGVRKIRLTGGEPLVRKDARRIIRELSQLPIELTLTTNGVLMDQYLPCLQESGVTSLNISLDTLDAQKFYLLTRRDYFERVWRNIFLTMHAGMHTKVNVVLMQGVNDGEINDFVALTRDNPLHIRFIEFMPFVANDWSRNKVVPMEAILRTISSMFEIEKLGDGPNDTAKKFRVKGFVGTFAIISTVSEPFCSGCNRMRLTAAGKMRNCLFAASETDLLTPLRSGQDLVPIITQCVLEKRPARGQFDEGILLHDRSMIQIGG